MLVLKSTKQDSMEKPLSNFLKPLLFENRILSCNCGNGGEQE